MGAGKKDNSQLSLTSLKNPIFEECLSVCSCIPGIKVHFFLLSQKIIGMSVVFWNIARGLYRY